ncbi:MAG: hypothetical protein KGL39_47155 [Patescibacteria group bacterium]|nr:hypothetical protein [Patescibacteria group bacterium]
MTIETRTKKAALLPLLKFVAFEMESLGDGYINLEVEDRDCDNLTDLLDRYKIQWRVI